MRLHAALALFTLVSASFAQYEGALPPPEKWERGFESIKDEQMHEWIDLLAGEEFAGRGTGQVGFTKAAHWVSGKLAAWGYEPVGDGGTYFQGLPFERTAPVPSSFSLVGQGIAFDQGEIAFSSISAPLDASAKVAFVSASGAEAELADAEGLLGAIFIVSERATDRGFMFRLRNLRPAAILTVVDELPEPEARIGMSGGDRGRFGVPTGGITRQAARQLADALGVDPTLTVASTTPGIRTGISAAPVNISANVETQPVTAPNVLGYWPGSDPELRDELIIVGAHLDHLGTRDGTIYPGADDNASGSAAILGVAQALAANPIKPKRSVLFIWFTGEEMGLLGSRHYTENPVFPIENTIAMLNIDMIGRNEEKEDEPAADNEDTMHLVNSRVVSDDIHNVVLNANQYVGLEFEYDEEVTVGGRSDHASFMRAGIPVAFIFGGFNPHYHQASDQPTHGINYDKVANAAKLYYLTLMELASR